MQIKLNGQLKNVDHFKYLGSVIDTDGTVDRDVDLRVQAAWSSWRKLTGVLYDRKIPIRLKAKVYEAIITDQTGSDVRERMLGDEGDQQEEDCYHGDKDASRDPRSVDTGSHAKRRHSMHITACTDRRGYAQWLSSLVWTSPKKRYEQRHPHSDGPGSTRRRGSPKKTWHQQMKEDMMGVGVTQDVALDRKEWRRTMPTPGR